MLFEGADVIMEVLHILRGLAPALDVQSVDKCLPALAPLLASISMQGNRIAICQSLEEFARIDSSLSTVVCKLIRSVFAGDPSRTFCSVFFMILSYHVKMLFLAHTVCVLICVSHVLSFRGFIATYLPC